MKKVLSFAKDTRAVDACITAVMAAGAFTLMVVTSAIFG